MIKKVTVTPLDLNGKDINSKPPAMTPLEVHEKKVEFSCSGQLIIWNDKGTGWKLDLP
jgi:hypothetical protein